MNVRAVIFDVYGTLLEVGPSPADAGVRWTALWQHRLGRTPRLSADEFAAATRAAIAREHARAAAAGIRWPEVYWPDIVREVLPELAACSVAMQDDFMLEQAGLWHTVRLMAGAAEVLRGFAARQLLLGLASNAQPYTLRELDRELVQVGLSGDMFAADLRFWSFAHGFSKPNPHVFRLLSSRLRAHGVLPAETLMVGDRVDNDIAPAEQQGWRTWRLASGGTSDASGPWRALADFVANSGVR